MDKVGKHKLLTNVDNRWELSNMIKQICHLVYLHLIFILPVQFDNFYALTSLREYCCSMVAAFGSGAMFSLVSGMGGPNLAANAVTSGVFFALVQGGLFKV